MDVLKEDMDMVDVTVEETGEQAEVGADDQLWRPSKGAEI